MTLPSNHQILFPIIITVIFLILFLLERLFPLRARKRPIIHRLLINFCLTMLVFLVGNLIVTPSGLRLAGLTEVNSFGLLHLLNLPIYAQFIIGFLLMDLTFYYWHRANHEIKLLWRFHNIHHIDPDLDVTTSFRFHFVEILYSTIFRIIQVGLIGVLPITYIVYELIFSSGTVFHHSNFHIPIRIERLLNTVFVTPRMHGIHHSVIKGETNSNYSVIFRWWDYFHRSLNLNISQSQVVIGVAGYQGPKDNNLLKLLNFPFKKQRDYWTSPDGTTPKREIKITGPKKHVLVE